MQNNSMYHSPPGYPPFYQKGLLLFANGITHDNFDSSVIVIKMSNIFVGDYRIAADRLLMIEKFLSLINPTLFINPSVRYRI